MIGRAIEDARQLLGPLDPTRQPHDLVAAEERAVDLQRIVSTPRSAIAVDHSARKASYGQPRRISGRLVLAAGVAAIAVAVGTTVAVRPTSPGPAFAATPVALSYQRPTSPQQVSTVLEGIAANALRSGAGSGDPATGIQHLRIQSWSLSTRIDGKQVTSAVIPEEWETWRAPDGSGRQVVHRLPPIFRSDEDRRIWEQHGAPGADTAAETREYGPGQFPVVWRSAAPVEPDRLKEWLAVGHPAGNGPAERVVAITDLYREQVLSARQRAAVLRVLADVPGLSYDGMVTDRAARRGHAFSIESDFSGLPTRYTVIVDPVTGGLLGYEETLTQDAGKLNVAIPAVIGYETYLEASHTPSGR